LKHFFRQSPTLSGIISFRFPNYLSILLVLLLLPKMRAFSITVASTGKDRGHFTRGGSTITQQLVKNLFLTTHRSLLRKALEFTLTPLAEMMLSKERILELYLNIVEWGPGVYGAEAAAQFHYGISARRLTRDQAVRLVACLPAPLERRPQEMVERAVDILDRMRDMGW
jgi:monofunctional glycosyltransferase